MQRQEVQLKHRRNETQVFHVSSNNQSEWLTKNVESNLFIINHHSIVIINIYPNTMPCFIQ